MVTAKMEKMHAFVRSSLERVALELLLLEFDVWKLQFEGSVNQLNPNLIGDKGHVICYMKTKSYGSGCVHHSLNTVLARKRVDVKIAYRDKAN